MIVNYPGDQTLIVSFLMFRRVVVRAGFTVYTQTYDYITPILQKLSVGHRIHFKIVLITYKSINDMALEYLCKLVSIKISSGKLRSSSQIPLQVPLSRLKSYGDCAFSVTAPLCGIDCRQILEMLRLLKILNLF